MDEKERADALALLRAAAERPGGKVYVRAAINAVGGGLPFVGGAITAANGLWGELEQSQFNSLVAHWATVADDSIAALIEALDRLPAEPSRAALALLLGELFGDQLAEMLLDGQPHTLGVIFNPASLSEMEPFIHKGLVSIRSTGSVCSMGSNNRIGGHIEELKRPYGMGSGFELTIA